MFDQPERAKALKVEKGFKWAQLSAGNSVENTFSRGRLKLLLYALKVTQNSLIESETDKQSILLIDDLPSELSEDTKEKVGQLLTHCSSQIFISSIN